MPPDIWGNLHRKVKKTYIDKRRAYIDSKKSNPTTDGDNNNNSTHNVRFVNGEDPSGGSLPSILCNRGSTDSGVQGGESAGTPILPSNAAPRIRNLISNNHIMQSCLVDERSINLRNTKTGVRACVDSGADTCLFNPGDVHVESTTNRVVDLKTVGTNGKRDNVLIGTCIITVEIEGKPTLLVFNESLIGKEGDTNIISANQVHKFGHCVDDLARLFGGKQCIQLTSTKSVIPLEPLQRALVSLPFRKPTEEELRNSKRIYMTSDMPWDPNTLRGQSREEQAAINAVDRIDLGNVESDDNDDIKTINCIRNRMRSRVNANVSTESAGERVTFVKDVCNIPCESALYFGAERDRSELNLLELEPSLEDTLGILDQRSIKLQSTLDPSPAPELIEDVREKLGWVTQNVADRTLQATTQLLKNFLRLPLQRHFKSHEPILNRNRLAKEYCTDTFFSETKSIEGKMAAQIFVGRKSFYMAEGIWDVCRPKEKPLPL